MAPSLSFIATSARFMYDFPSDMNIYEISPISAKTFSFWYQNTSRMPARRLLLCFCDKFVTNTTLTLKIHEFLLRNHSPAVLDHDLTKI